MTAADPPRIVACVGQAERAVPIEGARQLAACVGSAIGAEWPVRMRFIASGETPPPAIALVTTLIADVASDAPLATVDTRWRESVARWFAAGQQRILLCTLFRSVADPAVRAARIERIRRLNLLAIGLSRDTGVEIVDVDRLFALCGARAIGTDYRCTGPAADGLAGHAIAAAILAGDLGAALDPAVQERAAHALGSVGDTQALILQHVTGARAQ